MSGVDAVVRERVHGTGAAEVRLNFVQDEDDVPLAAEPLQQLQVLGLGMKRTAAAQIGFGNQAADAVAKFLGRPARVPAR